MSPRTCQVPAQALADLVFGDGSPRPGLDEHLASCESCRQALAGYRKAADALCGAEPPAQSEDGRRRQIAAALRAARSQPARTAPRFRGWTAFAGGALATAAAALVAFIALRVPDPTSSPGWAVLESGHLGEGGASFESGATLTREGLLEVPAGAEAKLKLADGSEVEAVEGSRFSASVAVGSSFGLESGRLTFSVRPRPKDSPFVVETAEARVTVVGTRFMVSRALTGAGPVTEVSVEHGIVEVRSAADGTVRRLMAGERLRVPPEVAASPGSSAPGQVEEQAAPEKTASRPVAPRHRPPPADAAGIEYIRNRIQAGQLKEARALIARARGAGPGADLAELAVVEAEATLAEGRHGAAIDAYLAVTRKFPGTPQAEEALFAAASLAVDHAGRARGLQLLRQYQSTYPRGSFSEDVRRLQKALGGPGR